MVRIIAIPVEVASLALYHKDTRIRCEKTEMEPLQLSKFDLEKLKEKIADIRERQKDVELELIMAQASCPHPELIEGFSIVACVQPAIFCTTCGQMNPTSNIKGGSDALGEEYDELSSGD